MNEQPGSSPSVLDFANLHDKNMQFVVRAGAAQKDVSAALHLFTSFPPHPCSYSTFWLLSSLSCLAAELQFLSLNIQSTVWVKWTLAHIQF